MKTKLIDRTIRNLEEAFAWSESELGYEYWDEVHNNLMIEKIRILDIKPTNKPDACLLCKKELHTEEKERNGLLCHDCSYRAYPIKNKGTVFLPRVLVGYRVKFDRVFLSNAKGHLVKNVGNKGYTYIKKQNSEGRNYVKLQWVKPNV